MSLKLIIDAVKVKLIAQYNDMGAKGHCTKATDCIINVGLIKGHFFVVAKMVANDEYRTNVQLAEFVACGKVLMRTLFKIVNPSERKYYI